MCLSTDKNRFQRCHDRNFDESVVCVCNVSGVLVYKVCCDGMLFYLLVRIVISYPNTTEHEPLCTKTDAAIKSTGE
jgi:hypothetical protein